MSAPINPGNSGGPLLNDLGSVVGVTAAIVSESQGVGFAVPSNAIQREINQLVTTGGYDGHSYLGVSGRDMDYETAQQMGVNVTYGWLVATVTAGGPSATAGVQVNDIIVGLNSTNVRSGDEMSSYLEEHTLPNETLIVTVYRGTSARDIPVTLGRRPAPPA
jgi:S1-C subfamily serine protease